VLTEVETACGVQMQTKLWNRKNFIFNETVIDSNEKSNYNLEQEKFGIHEIDVSQVYLVKKEGFLLPRDILRILITKTI
jgi:hypothetical protein